MNNLIPCRDYLSAVEQDKNNDQLLFTLNIILIKIVSSIERQDLSLECNRQ